MSDNTTAAEVIAPEAAAVPTAAASDLRFEVSEGVVPEGARKIRSDVFQVEQGFEVEFDETDDVATHLVLLDGEEPVAVCRVYPVEEPGTWQFARLAVAKPRRHQGHAMRVLAEAERIVREHGGTRVILHSQEHAMGMYERAGYVAIAEVDYEDEGAPHCWMAREL